MTWLLAPALVILAQLSSAAPDAQITARAELNARQASVDPSLLGWVSTSGASEFSDLRSCDFPATLSKSGSYAQCCGTSGSCDFFTSCNAGTLLAASTSIFCDQGFCNTGVIVSTTGASGGESFLGCWATSLGTGAFTLVQDIGSAAIATPTAGSSQASGSGSGSGAASTARASRASGSGSATGSSGSTVTVGGSSPNSTGAAAVQGTRPLTGIVGFLAGLLALL